MNAADALIETTAWAGTAADFEATRPKLRKIEIPKFIYAIFARVLYNFCYDMRWDRLSHTILVHKFNLFPDRRRWQIQKWVAQFRRQHLFPNASKSELEALAKDLVIGNLI